jgi:flagellin-like hook-associated protein FlgL
MSSGITLTAATRQNLLSLQGTADLLTQTQNRLSTGKKVNSALDDPTSFFTSQSLTGRSGDLGSLLNGISNGVQTIQAANQGITSIQKLVDSAKSTANQALADKSAVTSGLAATAATVSGSKSFQGLAGTADGTQDFSSVAKDGSLDISLDGGKTKTTIRLDSSTLANNSSDLTKVSASQLVTAINSQISNSAALKGKVTASVGGDGRINFATTSSGATQQLSVSGSTSSTLDIGFGKASSTTNAKVAAGAAFGTPTFSATAGSFLSVGDGNVTASLAVNSTTLKSDGTAVGVGPSADDVVDAYNVQLKAAGSTVSAFNNAGTIEFRAQDVGPTGVVTVSVAAPPSGSTQVTTGFGTATGASTGTFTAGTGTAATGLSSTGSDATDGSAKAIINGSVAVADATGGPPATAGGLDLSGTRNGSFTIQLGSGPAKTITLDASKITAAGGTAGFASRDSIAAAINTQIAADTGLAGNVSASFDANNKLVLSSTNAGSTQKITVTAAQGTTVANNVNIGLGTQTSTVNGTSTNTAVALTSTGKDSSGSTNSTRTTLSKQFNEILNQITQQAKDSSYNGINLLYRSGTDASENSLKVTFNETGTSSLSIAGAKLDSDGLGLTAVTGGFQTDDEINKTLTAITTATSQLRAQSSTFGSNLSIVQNRQDFSKNLINILDTGAANLTNADLNEEAANSQALSTRQSIGISALSLANTAQQGILQLLR